MDAKRIVPVLPVIAGRVPGPGPEAPALRARRLEMQGADEVLFEVADGAGWAWLDEAARTVFVPLAVRAGFSGPEDLDAALAAGADRVVLAGGDPQRWAGALARHGATRVAVALDLAWDPERGWTCEGQPALARLEAWIHAGAGELLLAAEAGAEAWADLWPALRRLPVAVLCRADGAEAAGEALAQGADGALCPAAGMPPAALKHSLEGRGLFLRR